jgi:hypothetical protein
LILPFIFFNKTEQEKYDPSKSLTALMIFELQVHTDEDVR